MKIREGLYFCEWCSLEFEQKVGKISGKGSKGVAVNQCLCPKCNRHVSQKTKIEREAKISRGHRV